MSKQKPIPTNRVIAFIRSGKYLRMIDAKELDWQFITAGEGLGNGKQKKDVELAFYINADNDVIMRWEKPKEIVKVAGKLPNSKPPTKTDRQKYDDGIKEMQRRQKEEQEKTETIPFRYDKSAPNGILTHKDPRLNDDSIVEDLPTGRED